MLFVFFSMYSFFVPLACAEFSIEQKLFNICEKGDKNSLNTLLKEAEKAEEVVNTRNDQGYAPLHVAIFNKKLDIALSLIEYGADVNATSSDNLTPLHFIINCIPEGEVNNFINKFFDACEKKGISAHVNIKNEEGLSPLYCLLIKNWSMQCLPNSILEQKLVERFIKKGAPINEVNSKNGNSLLHVVCMGHSHLARFFIDNGAMVNAKNFKGETPLHTASYYSLSSQKSLKALLESGKIENINEKDNLFGDTALHRVAMWAFSKKQILALKMLLEYPGIDINIQNKEGNTALHTASCYDRVVAIRVLLKYPGIDINMRNNKGETAFYIAQRKNHNKITKLFESYKKNRTKNLVPQCDPTPTIPGKRLDAAKDLYQVPTDFYEACAEFFKEIKAGKLETVRKFLDAHPSLIKEKDEDGLTPLHIATEYGRVDIAELFILNKNINESINAQDDNKETALHKVFKSTNNSKTETLSVLLNVQGIDVNVPNKHRYLPLHYAAASGKLEEVKLLVERGAKIDGYNLKGETPIFGAIYNGNLTIVKFLIKNGADINSIDLHLTTPLHAASKMGHREIAELLVQSGANIYAKDSQGKTALDISSGTGKEYLSKIMKNRTISSGMQIASLCLVISAAACAWHESKSAPSSKEKKKCFKKILYQKKKTILLGLSSLALFGGSFYIKQV